MKDTGWSTLRRRVHTAVILAVLSLTLILWGIGPFFVEAAFMATAGTAEFFDMVERKGLRPARRLGTLLTLVLLAAACHFSLDVLFMVYFGSFVVLLVAMVGRVSERRSVLLDTAATWMGISYLGLFSFMLLLRQLPGTLTVLGFPVSNGAALLLLLVSLCAATDIGAYFIGRSWGRHKLYPAVSPKKTWEGSIGGLLCAGAVMAAVAPSWGWDSKTAIFIGILVSLTGQVGDLWESALKREVGVKDSGDLLGAHGGVLDRFDSLAFAAPTFYLLGRWTGWF